jgi:helix-turn-helix protein
MVCSLTTEVENGALYRMGKSIDPEAWYTARQTADHLGEVTEATVKEYCKKHKLKCKKVGPKKRWMILGSSIIAQRRKWDLD